MAHFASTIVNAVKQERANKGTAYYDKIKGGYSVKVVGWNKGSYDAAVRIAEEQGYIAVLKITPEFSCVRGGGYGGATRIHIVEKTAA